MKGNTYKDTCFREVERCLVLIISRRSVVATTLLSRGKHRPGFPFLDEPTFANFKSQSRRFRINDATNLFMGIMDIDLKSVFSPLEYYLGPRRNFLHV